MSDINDLIGIQCFFLLTFPYNLSFQCHVLQIYLLSVVFSFENVSACVIYWFCYVLGSIEKRVSKQHNVQYNNRCKIIYEFMQLNLRSRNCTVHHIFICVINVFRSRFSTEKVELPEISSLFIKQRYFGVLFLTVLIFFKANFLDLLSAFT